MKKVVADIRNDSDAPDSWNVILVRFDKKILLWTFVMFFFSLTSMFLLIHIHLHLHLSRKIYLSNCLMGVNLVFSIIFIRTRYLKPTPALTNWCYPAILPSQ